MQLEWDEKKRASNLAKHGIDFIDLKPLFDGRELMQRWIYKRGERRCQLIGRLMGCVLFVVYAERLGRRRIISARLASRKE